MNLEECASHDGLSLARLVAQREVTPEELATLCRKAIETLNGDINAAPVSSASLEALPMEASRRLPVRPTRPHGTCREG